MGRMNSWRVTNRRGRLGLLLLVLGLWLGGMAVPASAGVEPGSLDINRATVEELQALPFIGEVRARAIVEYRRQHGPFATIDDLLNSETIGPRTLEAIRPYLRQAGTVTALNLRRVVVTQPGQIQILCDRHYYPALLDLVRGAGRRIEVAMFVVRATGATGNRPTVIVDELIAASRRGVEVSVLLEKSGHDQGLNREHERLARILRQGGVTVRFDSEEVTTHVKAILVDHRFVLLGSHNLTQAALGYNHECSLLVDSRELASQLSAHLKQIR